MAKAYFYGRLTEEGVYSFDVFALDKVLIPINDNTAHWFLAEVYIEIKQTRVFDFMGKDHQAVHDTLQRWISDEWRGRGRPTTKQLY